MKLLVAVILVASLYEIASAIESPIIGIVGLPISEGCIAKKRSVDYMATTGHSSCFTSYYVKWIESGGGRVLPIEYDTPPEELEEIYKHINGVLFTGGELKTLGLNTPYVKTAAHLLKLSMSDPKDYFPIWATCEGFQMMHVLISQHFGDELLSRVDAEDISWPLSLTANARSSRLMSNLPTEVVDILASKNVTLNFHSYSIAPSAYTKYPALPAFFDVLSTNLDRNGVEFVSTVEAKNYPIYASQWHPERQQFEFNVQDTGLVHTYDSIRANQAASAFFINECRKSNHSFSSEQEAEKYLIYNYSPVFTGASRQVYTF